MSTGGVGAGALLRMSSGAFVWLSAFISLYAGYSLACQNLDIAESAGLANPVTLGLLAIALVHVAVMGWLWARWLRRPVVAQAGETDASRAFRHRVEGLVLGVSSTALVFLTFPVLMVSPCPG